MFTSLCSLSDDDPDDRPPQNSARTSDAIEENRADDDGWAPRELRTCAVQETVVDAEYASLASVT